MAEVFSAIRAEASAGAATPSRACCAELDAKQPSAQGTSTNAVDSRLVASGHSASPMATSVSVNATARWVPVRSMKRDSSTLPINPKAPNQANSSVISPGVAASTCL